MILVCGEALIDLFMEPDCRGGLLLKPIIGGSPLNLAIGLARLETAVAFFGGVSRDRLGSLLAAALQQEGVATSFLKRSDHPTPLVLVSPDSEGHPSYTFYAGDSAVQDVTETDTLGAVPSSLSAVALGSYAIAVEPVGSALLSLARRESHRTVVALDCNLRPALVGPLHLWRQRIEELACQASIVKLSEEDFSHGWSGQGTPDDQAASWLELGVKLVVMTAGARGATAWHRSGRVTVPGRSVEVVDTVGAGDSFQAALLARLAHNGLLDARSLSSLDRPSVEDALQYANLAASITCGRQGAELPYRDEIERS